MPTISIGTVEHCKRSGSASRRDALAVVDWYIKRRICKGRALCAYTHFNGATLIRHTAGNRLVVGPSGNLPK